MNADQPELLPGMPIDPDGLLAANLDDVPASQWSQRLVQMIEVMEAAFIRRGEPKERAFLLARDAAVSLAEYHGGRQFYIPRGDALLTALRDAEIFRRVKRGNIQLLAEEYGLTDRHIWRIYRTQRKLHLDKVQGRLFNDKESAS